MTRKELSTAHVGSTIFYGILTEENSMPIVEGWIEQAIIRIRETIGKEVSVGDMESEISDRDWIWYAGEDDDGNALVDMDILREQLDFVIENRIEWLKEED